MVVSELWCERQCIGDVDDLQPKAAPKLREVAIRNLAQFEIFSERLKKNSSVFCTRKCCEMQITMKRT